MRRWNLLVLVPLLVAMVITLGGAKDASSPSTNFKGKVVAKNSDTHYVVVTFTCSPSSTPGMPGTLTAGWTYEVSSTQSFTGTLGSPAPCSVVSNDGGVTWTTSIDGMPPGPLTAPLLYPGMVSSVGTLTLLFSDIGNTKVYTTNVGCSTTTFSSPACVVVDITSFSLVPNSDFFSQCSPPSCVSPFPYATLNLSVR